MTVNKNQIILILDFGSQYSQLIARRIRELNIFSKIIPFFTPIDEISKDKPIGIILSGGPASVTEIDSPACAKEVFELGSSPRNMLWSPINGLNIRRKSN